MANPPSNPEYLMDYAGGCFDPSRNEMLVWGGGHGGYPGNEVYALTLDPPSARMVGLRGPVLVSGVTAETLADGSPNARHTYDSLVYVPPLDAMFGYGGSLWYSGTGTRAAWLFRRATGTWERMPDHPDWNYPANAVSIPAVCAWDEARQRVLVRGKIYCSDFDPMLRRWAIRKSTTGMGREMTGLFDPRRRRFVLLGSSAQITQQLWTIGLDGQWFGPIIPPITGPVFHDVKAPGFVYDEVGDRYIGWRGGKTLYAIDPTTWATTTLAPLTGATPAARPEGTFHRFVRVPPPLDAVAVVSDIDECVFLYRFNRGAGVAVYRSPMTFTVGVA